MCSSDLGHFFLFERLEADPTPVGGNAYYTSPEGCWPDKASVYARAAKKNGKRLEGRDDYTMWGWSMFEIENRRRRIQEEKERNRQEAERRRQDGVRAQQKTERDLDVLFFGPEQDKH